MPLFLSQFLRFVLKLVLAALGLIFVLSLLAAALIALVLSLFWSLLTGRKPAPTMVFGRFQRFSPRGLWPATSSDNDAQPAAGRSDVVDVEVREVHDARDAQNGSKNDSQLPK